MESLFAVRGKLQEMYAGHSRIFDKALQFVLALVTFFMINNSIGFMKMVAQPVASLALAVICTFFPMTMTILAAAGLIILHLFSVSIGWSIVTAVIFLVMFIFYFRLTPKKAMVVLLTALAFMLKIPYVIPLAYALVATPITMIAIAFGTVTYYMIQYVKNAAASVQGEDVDGLMTQISVYVKQVFQNKEMWIVIVAFVICFLLVYTIRRQSANHAWKIAIAAGAVANVVIIAGGNIALGVETAFGSLIIGSVAAIVVGMILELFFFTVDYSRSENIQFEDDEYYYYVKAVPKLNVASGEKTVKRINERQETEIIDTETVKKSAKPVEKKQEKAAKSARPAQSAAKKKVPARRPAPKKGPSAKKHDIDEVNKMLLTQSLKRDLNLKD